MELAIIGGGAARNDGRFDSGRMDGGNHHSVRTANPPGAEAASHRQWPVQPEQPDLRPQPLSWRASRFRPPCPGRLRRDGHLGDSSRQRGLLTIAEPDGKCYPYSDQANSVLDTLRLALDAAGVVVRTDWPVEAIRPGKSGGFTLTGSAGSLWADRVILTAGGAAAPKLGGTKSGYQLAKTLGHKCTRLHPSLVQLNTDPTWPKSLKGVRADAVVKLLMGQELAAEEAGQVQFTDYGVSGPVIFQLSRLAVTADVPVLLSLDLLPHVSQEELVELLAQRQMLCPGLTLENLLTGMLHNRLGRTVIRYGGRKLGDAVMDLTRKNLTAIAKNIKDFRLPVTGDQGLEHAQGHRRRPGHQPV